MPPGGDAGTCADELWPHGEELIKEGSSTSSRHVIPWSMCQWEPCWHGLGCVSHSKVPLLAIMRRIVSSGCKIMLLVVTDYLSACPLHLHPWRTHHGMRHTIGTTHNRYYIFCCY